MAISDETSERLIHARRLESRYLVPRDHPAPEGLRAKLDEVAVTVLRDALGATLYQYLDPASDEIWFIRRLELDVSVNAAWEADRLARVWAEQVARELVTAIESGDYEGEVVRFQSRTAYISQFIADLIDDCAWSRWYYQSFEGLKLVPTPAAIRTIVCDNPEVGIDALAQLPPEKIKRVVAMLSIPDARRVLQAVPFANGRCTMRQLLETAWRTYEASPEVMEYGEDDRVALAVCLAVARMERASLDRSLQVAARAILRLIRVAQRSRDVLPTIRQILESGNSTPLYVVLPPEDASALGPLVEGGATWLDDVFAAVTSRVAGEVAPASDISDIEEIVIRQTPFGGAFILFPMISELPIDAATAEWPACGDTPAPALVRYFVLAKCLGGACAPRMLMDNVVREMLGLDPKLLWHDVVAWYAERSRAEHTQLISAVASWLRARHGVNYQRGPFDGEPQRRLSNWPYLAFVEPLTESVSAFRAFGLAAYAVLTTFAQKLPGFSQSSFPHLRANFLECAATLEDQATRRVVQLTRPPLDLILNMTGLSRTTYRLPWLDARSIALFPHGGG